MKTHNTVKNSLLLGAILTIIFSSCHREDYFYEIDDAPLFEWTDHFSQLAPEILLDTVKTNHEFYYEFRCSDVHVKAPVLAMAHTEGNFDYEFVDNILRISAMDIGYVQGTITATDIYGKSSELSFQLYAFFNTRPVAKGNAQLIQNLSESEVEIDLSQSYDTDANKGGGIEQYEYRITSPSEIVYSVVTPLSKINYIFKEKGLATIEFRVCDNDGEWSEWETIYVRI